LPKNARESDFLYGKAALDHYDQYVTVQRAVMNQRLNEEKGLQKLILLDKKLKIEEALQLAKGLRWHQLVN